MSQYAKKRFLVIDDQPQARDALRSRLIDRFKTDFPNLRGNVIRLENGPPVGYPVQFRVLGPDIPTVRRLAGEVAAVMRGNPHLADVHPDWDEQSKVLHVEVDQHKARLLGLTTQDVANFLLSNMTLFFIPAAVGLGAYWTQLADTWMSVAVMVLTRLRPSVILRPLLDSILKKPPDTGVIALPSGTSARATVLPSTW